MVAVGGRNIVWEPIFANRVFCPDDKAGTNNGQSGFGAGTKKIVNLLSSTHHQ